MTATRFALRTPVAFRLHRGKGATHIFHDARILLLDEPTRGIDVASEEVICQRIGRAAAAGNAVVFVSSYLPELLGVCETIAVMCRGVLSVAKPASQWTEHAIIATAMTHDRAMASFVETDRATKKRPRTIGRNSRPAQ